MRKSGYLEKQDKIALAYAQAGERIGRQMMADLLFPVLNEECGFGYKTIKRILEALEKKHDIFHDALNGGPEADYYQEKLDQSIAEIIKGKEQFTPFRERYPDLRVIYTGKKKRRN